MLASLLVPPGVYSIVTYSDLIASMESQAQIDAAAINFEIIGKTPRLWMFQEVRLKELMSHRIAEEALAKEFLRVIDSNEKVVAAVGILQAWPVVARSLTLFDAGRPVGRLEIQRSLQPMLFNAALLSLFGLVLAAASFVTLRIIPLRAVLQANAILQKRDASLAFANTVFTAVIEGSPDAIIGVDEHDQIISFNQHFIELYQVPRELAEAHADAPVLELVTSRMKDPASFHARVKYLYDHPDETSHDRIDLKDGRVVDRHTRTLYGPDNKYLGRIWFFRDITERERAAEALKQSEARFRAIFDNARDGIMLVEADSKMLATGNDHLCDMLGYSLDELPKLAVADIHPVELLPRIMKEFEQRARGVTGQLVDIPVKRKDGSIFFADINAAPVKIGGKQYVLGIFRDITDRKAAADKLEFAKSLLEAEIESSPDAVLVVQSDRPIASYNRNFLEMWAVPPEVAESHDSRAVLAAALTKLKNPEGFERDIQRLRDNPETTIQREIEFKDGRVLECHAGAIRQRDGEILGRIWFLRDITERKLAAEKLHQRDALLHAVAVSATEFLTAPTLDEAMPRALELVSKTVQADRITVLEGGASRHTPPSLRYIWQAADVQIPIDARFFENPDLITGEIAALQTAAVAGETFLSNLQTASGALKTMLEHIGVKTLLIVPIMIDGKPWGQIGFDSCKAERSWADFEIEILHTLAELIGNAIRRERYVSEIANANRIVQNTPTILYRMRGEPSLPMIYISQNIKLFGHEPAALIASPHLYQSLVHPDDISRLRSSMARVLEKDGQRGVIEFRFLTSHGDYRWVENRYTPIRDSAGRLAEIEGLLIDITERKAAEDKIAQLARTDSLTGLANRSTFIERLQQAFAGARRGSPAFAVFYLDLDHFKDINDTLGHPIGDRVLTMVGERLKASVRETDLVARFGGDEFAVLQADLGDTSDAGSLALKIGAALAVPIQLGGSLLRMTASIGISTYVPDIAKPEDMLAQADVALYRAKEEGRDQYRFHSEALDIQVRERVALADELRMAVERAEFELYYQPQVELSTGQIVGMEALVRWNHPTRGLIMPSAFIVVAEKTGNMAAIGRWVFDHACRQMSLWRKAGIAPLTLAVNISLAQINAADEFIRFVTETLSKWGLAPADLEFDVTESMLARASLSQNDVLERLHKLGVKIAIDDFGAKFSTFDYLKTYRVNRLKIPQSLIAAAAADPESAAVVRAIVGIARELNIEIIAQGVETEAQWAYLTATSPVTKVQGFYYSEPVPAKRAEELLKRGRISPAESRRVTPR